MRLITNLEFDFLIYNKTSVLKLHEIYTIDLKCGVNGQIFIDLRWKCWQNIASTFSLPLLHFDNFYEPHYRYHFLCMHILKYLYSNFASILPHYTLMKVYFSNHFIIWVAKFRVKDAASAPWCLIHCFVSAAVSFQVIASWSLMSTLD